MWSVRLKNCPWGRSAVGGSTSGKWLAEPPPPGRRSLVESRRLKWCRRVDNVLAYTGVHPPPPGACQPCQPIGPSTPPWRGRSMQRTAFHVQGPCCHSPSVRSPALIRRQPRAWCRGHKGSAFCGARWGFRLCVRVGCALPCPPWGGSRPPPAQGP